MPKFIVHVVDKRIRHLEKEFEAVDAEEAAHMAEDEDWMPYNDWLEIAEDYTTENYIDGVRSSEDEDA